jgi:hypothetical protein
MWGYTIIGVLIIAFILIIMKEIRQSQKEKREIDPEDFL